MPNDTTSESPHRFRGSTFESMVETFTSSFGPLLVKPVGRPRDFRWSADFWSGAGVTLVTGYHHSECSMRVIADRLQYVSIIVPQIGGVDVALGRRTVQGRLGELLFTNNIEPEHVILRGGPIALDGLLFDHAIFANAVAATFEVPVSGSLELAPVLSLSTPAGRLIGSLAQTLIEGMRNDGPLLYCPVAISSLASTFADLVIRLVPHRLSPLLDKKPFMIAPRHVRSAISFMHANIHLPITMPMVSEAVGVSVRALEIGFRAFRETTPGAYLRMIRLRAARADLLDPSNRQSVRDVCLNWGFFHFGRFSILYRATYGESPSDTKRRSARM
ncbi:AraC family transcriptional regulator [Sinorhizobium sp. CCBAU 05631]|uniref:helix-turn-helix transcriptional regulator n=2 Tax=Sinorhizobium sp. CCBAU 05631 TaxID=794846 RepID=UPI0005665480|nr:AraC family transcriptional regulator [Sinorhizobium sp. CCBAU 05631]